MLRDSAQYYRRIFRAYLTAKPSQLTFWHDTPEVNDRADMDRLGEYYMTFRQKADYPGPYDQHGIPLLDYHGTIGRQYNPIAIAQYGLANFNMLMETGDPSRQHRFLAAADWLVANLEPNRLGVPVWHHYFNWEYRSRLVSPWYSGLAQGQGISLLARASVHTGRPMYSEAAQAAFQSFKKTTAEGGIVHRDADGALWLEEYIVDPPTHILNGFIWAIWGVRDYYILTNDETAYDLYNKVLRTLRQNLDRYDTGYWSLYEMSGTALKMVASLFYHSLHIVQLKVLHRLTHDSFFERVAVRWDGYRRSWLKRNAALAEKIVFKLCYY